MVQTKKEKSSIVSEYCSLSTAFKVFNIHATTPCPLHLTSTHVALKTKEDMLLSSRRITCCWKVRLRYDRIIIWKIEINTIKYKLHDLSEVQVVCIFFKIISEKIVSLPTDSLIPFVYFIMFRLRVWWVELDLQGEVKLTFVPVKCPEHRKHVSDKC